MSNESAESGLPPKQSPFKPLSAAPAEQNPPSAEEAARTVVLKRPTLRKPGESAPDAAAEPSAPVATGIAVSHEQAVKRMTSRINLNLSSETSKNADTSEAPTVVKKALPVEESSAGVVTGNSAMAAKSKTSRITLESAFNAQPSIPVGDQPKTIRLKRPADMSAPSTPKVTPLRPPTTPIAVPVMPSRTGTIPSAPENASTEVSQPTKPQLKTIKISRSGGGSAPKISLARRTDGVEDSAGQDDNLQSLSSYETGAHHAAPDVVNPVFIVAAVIALIVTLNLAWALAAQAFGPNCAAGDYARLVGPVIPDPPGLTSIK